MVAAHIAFSNCSELGLLFLTVYRLLLLQSMGSRARASIIVLNLIGTTVPAHRAILVARCEVMAAMFNGNYMEAKSVLIPVYGVSKETFYVTQ